MMDYEQEFEKAQAEGKTEQLVTQIIQWTEQGQVITGRVEEIVPFTAGTFETDVLQYILDTKSGRVSCVLGSAADKHITEKGVKPGWILRIVFMGKKDIGEGRRVNVFDIQALKVKRGS